MLDKMLLKQRPINTYVNVNETTLPEKNLKVDAINFRARDEAATIGVIAVSFHVNDAIIASKLNSNLNAIGKAHDLQVLDRRNGAHFSWCVRRRRREAAYLLVEGLSHLAVRANADGLVVTHGALGIWPADVARR